MNRVILLAVVALWGGFSHGRAVSDAEYVKSLQPRCLTARRIETFDQAATLKYMRANQVDLNEKAKFGLCECFVRPSTEIAYDVARDAKDVLHVTLYFQDIGKGPGAGDQNSIEIAFAPYGDLHAFIQCGITGRDHWVNSFWPFRDGRKDLSRQFERDVTISMHDEPMRELTERMVTFHVPVADIAAPESKGLVGFNMMRVNLTAGESATWNPTCGAAFPDASGFGFLRLDENAPQPAALPRAKPLDGKVQLQVEYDWPDEMVGGPYTYEAIRDELAFLRRHGVGRVYWIDYPAFNNCDGTESDKFPFATHSVIYKHAVETKKLLKGEDPMFVACRCAHELGMEFFTTIKPYDLFNDDFCAANGGKYGVRRNPAWTEPAGPKEVRKLTLVRDGDKPFEFDLKAIRVSTSLDNRTYAPATGFTVVEKALDYPNTVWTPAGNQPVAGTHKVRVLEFANLPGPCEYVAFEFPKGDWKFRNYRWELACAETDKGTVHGMCSNLRNKPDKNGIFDLKGVYEFVHDGAAAGWADQTEAIDRFYGFAAGGCFAVRLSTIATREDVLDPTFPEVRQYWLDTFVKRAIKAGADGVDVRVANHRVASDWLAYCYAEPVLKAFRERFGREPGVTAADIEAVRRIRGEGHTRFLLDAGKLLRAAGRKLEHHVEARMKADPSVDAYQGIHYDWKKWIEDGVVDGINLKYLGPFNRFVATEIMPRCQAKGVPVHQIAAYGDPRRNARTWEEDVAGIEQCRLGGVAGFNLYEVWCYLRTTPTGDRMIRGNALMVFEALKPYAR